MKTIAIIAILLVAGLSACSSEQVKRGTYEALYRKGCIERTASPDCDPDHQGYDEYEKERQEALKPR